MAMAGPIEAGSRFPASTAVRLGGPDSAEFVDTLPPGRCNLPGLGEPRGSLAGRPLDELASSTEVRLPPLGPPHRGATPHKSDQVDRRQFDLRPGHRGSVTQHSHQHDGNGISVDSPSAFCSRHCAWSRRDSGSAQMSNQQHGFIQPYPNGSGGVHQRFPHQLSVIDHRKRMSQRNGEGSDRIDCGIMDNPQGGNQRSYLANHQGGAGGGDFGGNEAASILNLQHGSNFTESGGGSATGSFTSAAVQNFGDQPATNSHHRPHHAQHPINQPRPRRGGSNNGGGLGRGGVNRNGGGSRASREQHVKTKMCPFLGTTHGCFNASECLFAHSVEELRERPDLTKTKLCTAFAAGSCELGERCTYAHGARELRSTPYLYKTDLCKYWAQGSCQCGDLCRHAHGPQDLKGEPPRHPRSGGDGGTVSSLISSLSTPHPNTIQPSPKSLHGPRSHASHKGNSSTRSNSANPNTSASTEDTFARFSPKASRKLADSWGSSSGTSAAVHHFGEGGAPLDGLSSSPTRTDASHASPAGDGPRPVSDRPEDGVGSPYQRREQVPRSPSYNRPRSKNSNGSVSGPGLFLDRSYRTGCLRSGNGGADHAFHECPVTQDFYGIDPQYIQQDGPESEGANIRSTFPHAALMSEPSESLASTGQMMGSYPPSTAIQFAGPISVEAGTPRTVPPGTAGVVQPQLTLGSFFMAPAMPGNPSPLVALAPLKQQPLQLVAALAAGSPPTSKPGVVHTATKDSTIDQAACRHVVPAIAQGTTVAMPAPPMMVVYPPPLVAFSVIGTPTNLPPGSLGSEEPSSVNGVAFPILPTSASFSMTPIASNGAAGIALMPVTGGTGMMHNGGVATSQTDALSVTLA